MSNCEQLLQEKCAAYSRLGCALDGALSALEMVMAPQVPGDGVHFRFISLAGCHFVLSIERAIAALRPTAEGQLRFLDVGAGIGTKLLVAEGLGLRATGIEIRPEYIEVARRLELNVELADAMTWDRYAEFDIVYAYRPMMTQESQAVLDARIQTMMRPGGVLFLVGYVSAPIGWEALAPDFTHDLWRKPSA